MKIRVGLFGFGKTGKLVADEFIKDDNFKMIKTKLNEKAYKAFISQHCEN